MTRDGGTWRAVFESMGSPCELLVEHESEAMARRIAHLARDEAGRIDRLYSRYRPDSIVTMLNASNGSRRRVDDETAKLLEYGAALWRMSEGRFDLTSGVLREASSYDALDPVGLYFGTQGGAVWVSPDEGDSWIEAAANLPPILSVEAHWE